MLASKKTNLKSILESKDGVHLTVYLVNRGDLIDLKSQLRTTISEAYEWLDAVMTSEERNKFLEPLDTLLKDVCLFKQMRGNIGIFLNEDMFRILNIPIDVDPFCHVATSFHVKPLLRWLQGDQEFLFLGLEKEAVHLYVGSQDTFKLVGSILYPELFKVSDSSYNYSSDKKVRQYKINEADAYSWINNRILGLTKHSNPKLFIAGEVPLVKALNKKLKYKNVVLNPVLNFFHNSLAIESVQNIRIILKEETKISMEKALLEFRFAEQSNRLKKNIFQIAKAVVQGKVRKLIVTDEINIFGKIDRKTGGLAIHPFDQDHEDDCILDDLAQMVLSQGGEVVIAKRQEIPKGRPILAILDDEGFPIEKTENIHYEVLQERFG